MGPSPMALGRFAFQGLGFGFDSLTHTTQTPWGEVDVAYRMAALHWLGPKMQEVTIRGAIFAEEFGGQASLDGLTAAALRGEPQMLVTYAGDIRGMFVIEGISEDRSSIRGDGLARKNGYEIKLKRYTGSAISGVLGGALASLIPAL